MQLNFTMLMITIKSKPQRPWETPYLPQSSPECFDPDTRKFSQELYHLFRRQRQMEASIDELQQIIDSCQNIADLETDEILDSIADEYKTFGNQPPRWKTM
jgi:hypothetical protein